MNKLLFLGNLGAGEIFVIALVVLLLFGGKHLFSWDMEHRIMPMRSMQHWTTPLKILVTTIFLWEL